MKKNYISDLETLEVGGNYISDHLAWLLRTAMYLTVGKNNAAVNTVVYSKFLPKSLGDKVEQGVWGMFHAAARSVVINLQQHAHAVMENIQDSEHMHNSIRALLLRELLDTVVHEAWHANVCANTGSWEEDDLDEQGARDRAWATSWGIAEHWDVNIEQFGPFFDTFLQEIYKDLKEDVQEDDCKEWKKIQFHMLDNDLNYYNPESGIEIRTIREVFQAHVRPEVPWMDIDNNLFTTFTPVKSIAQRITEEEREDYVSTGVADTKNISDSAVNTTDEMSEPAAPKLEPIEPVLDTAQMNQDNNETDANQAINTPSTTAVCTDYDPLSDMGIKMVNPFDDDDEPVMYTTTTNHTEVGNSNTITNTGVSHAPVAPAVDGSISQQQMQQQTPPIDVLRIQQIAEVVLRRMFHHVNTKCEFNTNGGFNNTNAILDPINISDIDGANELFAKQDTLDANGNFQSHVDVNGFVKGLPTADGLPRYTFYMNMGGKLHKRVFIAQNPSKRKVDGVTPTAFAAKAMAGNRIMMLLADGAGITADISLVPGQVLGQEVFKIWDKK